MKSTIRTITLITICFFTLQTAQAETGKIATKVAAKKLAKATNEEAHFVKGATPHDFVMPVNPMRPFKSPLV